jgi:iron complex outermembrane receptor protein
MRHSLPAVDPKSARDSSSRRDRRRIAGVAQSLAAAVCCASSAAHGQAAEPEVAAAPANLSTASLEELMDVRVTSVSRGESTIGESPAAIFVITPEMIRRSGATSIPELLRMVPGMEVGHIDSSKWGVSSRGFNDRFAKHLLVQVDGRTVYTPVNGGVYWDTVDYHFPDIERIEVIRGPGGSVWGANAVNGIINIITKSAKDTQGFSLLAGGGTEDRGFTSFRFGGSLGDNLQYRVYGKWQEHEGGFNLDGDAQDDWRNGRVGFRLDWKPRTDDTITFQGDYYHGMLGRRDLRASPETPPPFIRTNTEDEEPSGGDLLFRWTHELGKDSNWVLQAYYDYSKRRGTAGTFDFSVNTIDVDFQHQFPLGERQKVIWGAEYRLTEIFFVGTAAGFDNGFAIGSGPYVQRNLFSVFLQDEIQIVKDRLFLTLGSKFEHNEITGFEYQPTARLHWTPTKRQTVWAAVSRAVRTPTYLENDFELSSLPIPGTAIFPRGINNRDLDSEEVIAYELGYRAQATDKLSFDTALFFNRYDHLIVSQPGLRYVDPETGALISPGNRTNGEDADVYGVEVSTTWKATDWWRIYGQYTYLNMNLHADRKLPPASRDSFELVEKQSPRSQFYVRSSLDLPGNVEFDLVGRYVENLGGFTPGIKSYFTMDARLGWKPTKNLELAIVGQNLLDNHHPELGSSPLVRSPLVEVERSVYGVVTLTF